MSDDDLSCFYCLYVEEGLRQDELSSSIHLSGLNVYVFIFV